LNHVVRKYSEPLEEHANFLVSVPGGNDGPSGVLICSENYLTYKNLGDQHDIRCPIPRRRVSKSVSAIEWTLNILIQAYLILLRFTGIAFFTNRKFVATLRRASLSAPFFQQHMLASCVCHVLVILAIFQTLLLLFVLWLSVVSNL
jgi:hypothetical protein